MHSMPFPSLLRVSFAFPWHLYATGRQHLAQGFIEYTRDALTVTTAAHALCAATAWGSLLLASVPLYAVSVVASATARRSSNALSAFGGGAEGTPTATAAALRGRAQVRASLLCRAVCGGAACRPDWHRGHPPRRISAPVVYRWSTKEVVDCQSGPLKWQSADSILTCDVGGQQARTSGKWTSLIIVLTVCKWVARRHSAVGLFVPCIASSRSDYSVLGRSCTASNLAQRYEPPSRFILGYQPCTEKKHVGQRETYNKQRKSVFVEPSKRHGSLWTSTSSPHRQRGLDGESQKGSTCAGNCDIQS